MKNEIKINPKVLEWARRESGLRIPDIVADLGITENQYIEWESQEAPISFEKLQRLAKLYRRQIACFFLADVPKRKKRPKDYRNLKLVGQSFAPEIMLAIRRSHRFSETLLDLNGEKYYERKTEWLKEFFSEFGQNPNLAELEIANWVREKLKISLDAQRKFRYPGEAYKGWRNAIEDQLGISTFQFNMPMESVQGFCLNEYLPFSLVANNKQAPTGKIFTLFHELAHIIKGNSGICYHDQIEENQNEEFECNYFAGNLLVPLEVLEPLNTADEIYSASRKLKVSSEVYLRRMKTAHLVSDQSFFEILAEIRSNVRPSKSFGRSTQIQRAISSRGQHLFDSVVEGAKNGKISYSSAGDILGIKLNHLLGY